MKIHPRLALAVTAVGLFTCVGCQSLTSSTATGATTTASGPETGSTPTAKSRQPTSGPEIEVVKNGVLADFNTTTVGKALEGTFQNPKWTSFQTPKGATVVQFDGTVTVDALEAAHFAWRLSNITLSEKGPPYPPLPVRFQFLISADKKTFEIGSVDGQPFGYKPESAILDFVYR